jgi:hypothetical protein
MQEGDLVKNENMFTLLEMIDNCENSADIKHNNKAAWFKVAG